MKVQSSKIISAPWAIILTLLVFVLNITPNEAARILKDNNEKEVGFLEGNYELLLQSLQWNPVRPPTPTPNPGTNARTKMTSQISQRNFAGSKEFVHPPPPSYEYPRNKICICSGYGLNIYI
ncbi:hypothetical protein FXO38_17956 [Capsicum annuum]|nr:hypothetical protein FXO37_24416 [Capsicum annuum]KAF3648887.1 hypothetical protein FXO38_17956 [Capsicum annuum]